MGGGRDVGTSSAPQAFFKADGTLSAVSVVAKEGDYRPRQPGLGGATRTVPDWVRDDGGRPVALSPRGLVSDLRHLEDPEPGIAVAAQYILRSAYLVQVDAPEVGAARVHVVGDLRRCARVLATAR